jgi:ketosteroid isomerase-like protein
MRKKRLLIALVSVFLLLPACNRAADIDQERKSVQIVFDKYLESVNAADVALASQVWSQSPDSSAVTPLGRFKGWDNVRDGLYVNFLQKAFAERKLQPDNLAMNVSGNVAWAVFDWTFTAKLADGQPFSSQGWESHVYRKIDGRWVIVHLHYSAPPPPRQ